MELKELTKNIRDDFNRTISLAGVIPLLVFVYLLVGKVAGMHALTGQVGYIVLATIGVFLTGIVVGRRMLMSVTLKLIDDNQKILSMQQELIEKNRLAAITETVLALGDQVNNPLMIMSGNLELLDTDLRGVGLGEHVKKRLDTMRNSFNKIRDVTDRMSRLSHPVTLNIDGDQRMIDLEKSI